jgi:hypothetical protein
MDITTQMKEYIDEFYKLLPQYSIYFQDLSLLIGQTEAYNIITNIPDYKRRSNTEITFEYKKKIFKYNYIWCKYLLTKNIHLTIIKTLLNYYCDYYFLELLWINTFYNDFMKSFTFINENVQLFTVYKTNYYKLRLNGVSHLLSFRNSRCTELIINNIIELIKLGYNEQYYIESAKILTIDNMNLLKLSRLAYISIESFDKYKSNIFYNCIFYPITMEPFEDVVLIENFEPPAKKIKHEEDTD